MTLTVRVDDSEGEEAINNALEAAAAERGKGLNITRGRAGDGQITKSEALIAVARAYTGWPAEGDAS
ncbi:MAG: hypothetical protein ACOCUA_02960 [archaeon]